jgi:hypothetical protein
MTYLVAKPYSPRGFHEKAWSCQPETRFFRPGNRNSFQADQREAPRGRRSLLHRSVFPAGASAMRIADQREAHPCGPDPLAPSPLPPIRPASIRTLLGSSPAPVPFGVLNLKSGAAISVSK